MKQDLRRIGYTLHFSGHIDPIHVISTENVPHETKKWTWWIERKNNFGCWTLLLKKIPHCTPPSIHLRKRILSIVNEQGRTETLAEIQPEIHSELSYRPMHTWAPAQKHWLSFLSKTFCTGCEWHWAMRTNVAIYSKRFDGTFFDHMLKLNVFKFIFIILKYFSVIEGNEWNAVVLRLFAFTKIWKSAPGKNATQLGARSSFSELLKVLTIWNSSVEI